MIIVEDIHKRYQTLHGPGKWVLRGVSFTIPPKTNVGLIGGNGAGKSTLLRLIGGVDHPNRGRIERRCRVSWPMGFGGGLQGSLTGRQNAKFVCRIHGHESDIPERLAFIQDFAEIGEAFDEPVKTYSSGMQARLKFGISLAFDFDVYISDELTAVGDSAFKKKAKKAFRNLVDRAGLIMVSHAEGTLREFCQAGIWLYEGQAYWFDDVDDALEAYKNSEDSRIKEQQTAQLGRNPKHQAQLNRINRYKKSLELLEGGLKGRRVIVDDARGEILIRHAKQIGMELVPKGQIVKRGYRLKKGMMPILRRHVSAADKFIDLYDLNTQCVKLEAPND